VSWKINLNSAMWASEVRNRGLHNAGDWGHSRRMTGSHHRASRGAITPRWGRWCWRCWWCSCHGFAFGFVLRSSTPLLLGFGHSHVLLARLNKLHAINLRA